MEETSNGPVAFVLIISNLIYLFPAYLAWIVRYYELFSYLIALTFISSFHHLCADWGVCFDIPPEISAGLDMSFALIAIGITLSTVAIYELIRKDKWRHLLRNGYTVRLYPSSTRHRGDESDHQLVLVKHTYADIFISFLIVVTIVAVFTLGSSDVTVFAIVLVYVVIVWIFHWILYWEFKIETRQDRYYWPAIALALLFAFLSVLLFRYMERVEGRSYHSLWHITSAMTCAAWLIGTTAFWTFLKGKE